MLNPYFFFLFASLLISSLSWSQQKDTVKIDLKHSNILIVTENKEGNEWDFDKELNENLKEDKEEKKETATLFNVGLSLFSNSLEPWKNEYNNRIPYESIKSNNLGYTYYKTLFTFLNGYNKVYSGIGIQSCNISLGNNITNVNTSALSFSTDSLFNPTKNKLRCNYIQVPLLLGLHPLKLKKPAFQIQVGASFSYKIKALLITRENDGNNWLKTKTKGDFLLNPYFFNYHVNIIFKRIGLFSQFSSSSIFSDSNNDYLFSTGLIIGTFK